MEFEIRFEWNFVCAGDFYATILQKIQYRMSALHFCFYLILNNI